MRVRLFSKDAELVVVGTLPPFDEPPEVVLWGARVFIRDPMRLNPTDQWIRYREAWATTLVHETPPPAA